MGMTRTGTTGGSGAIGNMTPIAGAECIIAQVRYLKGIPAVKKEKKHFSIF
jgi:hypothetical protein